jgi:hypothetical protein
MLPVPRAAFRTNEWTTGVARVQWHHGLLQANSMPAALNVVIAVAAATRGLAARFAFIPRDPEGDMDQFREGSLRPAELQQLRWRQARLKLAFNDARSRRNSPDWLIRYPRRP